MRDLLDSFYALWVERAEFQVLVRVDLIEWHHNCSSKCLIHTGCQGQLFPASLGLRLFGLKVSTEGSIGLTDSLDALRLGAPPGRPTDRPSFPHPRTPQNPRHPEFPQKIILKVFICFKEDI